MFILRLGVWLSVSEKNSEGSFVNQKWMHQQCINRWHTKCTVCLSNANTKCFVNTFFSFMTWELWTSLFTYHSLWVLYECVCVCACSEVAAVLFCRAGWPMGSPRCSPDEGVFTGASPLLCPLLVRLVPQEQQAFNCLGLWPPPPAWCCLSWRRTLPALEYSPWQELLSPSFSTSLFFFFSSPPPCTWGTSAEVLVNWSKFKFMHWIEINNDLLAPLTALILLRYNNCQRWRSSVQ